MTQTETIIIGICQRKLRIDRIDPHDDLRRLGADSMFIVELAVELEDAFDIYVPTEALETNPRVDRIAAWVDTTLAG